MVGEYQQVTPSFELGINAVFHTLVLFSALTFLFMVVISKAEKKALQGEFNKALSENLELGLQSANQRSNGKLKEILKVFDAPLSVIEKRCKSQTRQPRCTIVVCTRTPI
jgi:hypothetical protein